MAVDDGGVERHANRIQAASFEAEIYMHASHSEFLNSEKSIQSIRVSE